MKPACHSTATEGIIFCCSECSMGLLEITDRRFHIGFQIFKDVSCQASTRRDTELSDALLTRIVRLWPKSRNIEENHAVPETCPTLSHSSDAGNVRIAPTPGMQHASIASRNLIVPQPRTDTRCGIIVLIDFSDVAKRRLPNTKSQ